MPTLKLTKTAIDRLAAPSPSGKQILFWDTALSGFGILTSGTTTAKSYIVQHGLDDGRTRRVTIGPTSVLSLEEARTRARALLADFLLGKDPKAERRAAIAERARQAKATLRAMLADYLDKNKKISRAATREYYRRMIEGNLADWLDLPMRDITPDMIEARHGEIAERIAAANKGSRRGGGPTTGQSTANQVMHLFGVIWGWASGPRLFPELGTCPTKVLTVEKQWFPSVERSRQVSEDQLPAFYAAIQDLENTTARDYLLLVLFTGLRRREAASLRWSDLDFAGRVIALPASRTKNKQALDLPMTTFLRDLFITRREVGVEGDYIFPANSKSGYLEDPSFALALVAAASGITVSVHDLRRTFVTVGKRCEGVSWVALKGLVNHKLPKSDQTSQYAQMSVDELRKPAQAICDRLLERCRAVREIAANVTRLN
jgi:integrase